MVQYERTNICSLENRTIAKIKRVGNALEFLDENGKCFFMAFDINRVYDGEGMLFSTEELDER